MMDGLLQDIRYAVRILANARAFTLAAVLTLALGIGANIAMFSVTYGVLLRPLPYRDADRLLRVYAEADYAGAHRPVPVHVQAGELKAWQRPLDSIASLAFYAADVAALSGENGSEVVDSAVVSSAFFSTLAGPFAAGRPLEAADDGLPSAVISERLARRLFRDPADAIGRPLLLTPRTYTVIGVAAGEFQFPSARVDVWLPAGFVHSVNPRCCGFRLIARLDPADTLERARAAVRPMFQTSAAGQAPATSAAHDVHGAGGAGRDAPHWRDAHEPESRAPPPRRSRGFNRPRPDGLVESGVRREAHRCADAGKGRSGD
jgi:hypothetical protein